MSTQVVSAVPVEISRFFNRVYGSEPELAQEKKSFVYSVPGRGISIITDSYRGCHIDVKEVSSEIVNLAREGIAELSESYKASGAFDSIWIDVALPASPYILGAIAPESFQIGQPGKGDLIYDYQQKKAKIWQWLNSSEECAIPSGATHNIGATALVLDETAKKALLIVNIRRSDAWNLPGGSYEPLRDKTPSDTALREAQEEGGFVIGKDTPVHLRLIGQMQFPQNQFAPAINQIWGAFIDGISQTALNPPTGEIQRAEWVDFSKIVESQGTLDGLKLGEEIRAPLIAAINELGFKEIVNKGWMIVHTGSL